MFDSILNRLTLDAPTHPVFPLASWRGDLRMVRPDLCPPDTYFHSRECLAWEDDLWTIDVAPETA